MQPIIITSSNVASDYARAFNLANIKPPVQTPANFNVPTDGMIADTALYSSAIGTPVFVDITLHGQTYTTEQGYTRVFPNITIYNVLLSVNQSRNIVKTSIQGRAGTIKEYMGKGDYSLQLYIVLTSNTPKSVYPRSQVQPLITALECTNAITVTSSYLNMFGINNIVVDSYDCNQDEGYYSRQVVNVNATSDEQENLRF
jgi:hypothetical protein